MNDKREFLILLPDGRGLKIHALNPAAALAEFRRTGIITNGYRRTNVPRGTQILEVKLRRNCA